MGPVESELRHQFAYALSGAGEVQDVMLDALDTQDVGAITDKVFTREAGDEALWLIVQFCRQATFRLAREVDDLRARSGDTDNPG